MNSGGPTARALLSGIARRKSCVLLYHGVGRTPAGEDPHNLVVPGESFRAQMRMLLAAGFEFVSLAELAARASGGEPPPGLAAVTFDDGMEDNFSVALPLLQEFGISATVFVQTGVIGEPNPWLGPGASARMLNEQEIRAMADAGVVIGAHSVTHPDMSTLSRDECLREMEMSRDALVEITGREVREFAYPFGHYGPQTVEAARAARFDLAVTCVNRGSWNPFELKRVLITRRDGVGGFLARVAGIYEPVVLGPLGSAARGATRGVRSRLRAMGG